MLLKRLTLDDITVGLKAKDWEEAIRKSSERLLECGCIEPTYVEEMIHVINEKGPYLVISPHVALAHARPECGVNEMGLSFALLETPVSFGVEEFDPVKLIVTLAAIDNKSHLNLLSELAEVLIDDERMDALYNAETREKIYEILTKG